MSHEGTSGMVAEAVAEVQAIVQALASEPNTPADDAQVNLEAGEGDVVRAVEEAVVGEVEHTVFVSDAPAAETQFRMGEAAANDCTAAPATEAVVAEAEVPDSGIRKGADVSETTVAAGVEARTAEAKEGVGKARVKVRKARKTRASTNPAKSNRRNRKGVQPVAVPEAVAKVRKTAAVAATKVVKARVKSSEAKPHITAVAKPKAQASKSTAAARKTVGTKPQAVKPPTPSAHKVESQNFTVPDVWRSIVKKNERQGGKLFDVLVCHHAVPANDNTYRRARACPECRLAVQKYADEAAASRAKKATRRRSV